MSRRIDIELTSARPDGTWTWRAAGAQKPKGVVDGAMLPGDASVGLVVRADVETDLDGSTVLSVQAAKGRTERSGLLELLPSDKPFEAVTQQLARRERSDRGDRGDRRERRPRRDGDGPDNRDRRPRREGAGREGQADGGERRERRPRREGEGGDRRPRFQAPPELPQRPKAKRLRPGRAHRNEILAGLSEAERPIAERFFQGGIAAVRAAVAEQNKTLRDEGKETVPEKSIVAIAENLAPRLRVADWLDRADAAIRDLEELDLRDLRSVVAAADEQISRDETARELAVRLKDALADKQEKELALWIDDIRAAIGVGRVVRALKLSSQPPKAGVRFPADVAALLAEATIGNLTADALPDRWVAVLEAAAFSPVRAQVTPTAAPTQSNDELATTVRRLAPLLPQVAALFGVEVDPKAPQPKPLRPTRPAGKPAARPQGSSAS